MLGNLVSRSNRQALVRIDYFHTQGEAKERSHDIDDIYTLPSITIAYPACESGERECILPMHNVE